jgi:rod shape-determining protein MreD
MIKSVFKFFIFGFLFYFLYLFQMSFLPFLNIFQVNFLFFLVLLINIIEDPQKNNGLYCAFFAGIFSDLFSSYFFGLITFIFLLMAILIKYILLRYVRIP